MLLFSPSTTNSPTHISIPPLISIPLTHSKPSNSTIIPLHHNRYDMHKDPQELTDISADRPDVVRVILQVSNWYMCVYVCICVCVDRPDVVRVILQVSDKYGYFNLS